MNANTPKGPPSSAALAGLHLFGGGFVIKAPGYSLHTTHFPAAVVGALYKAYTYDAGGALVAFEPLARVEDANGHVLWRPAEPTGPLRQREGLAALVNTFWIDPL